MTGSIHYAAPCFEDKNPIADFSSIGEVAKAHGVTLRSLRFYEQRGLLNPIRRGMARVYDERQIKRLKIILRSKHLGFTLSEIADLLADSDRADSAPELVVDEKMILEQLSLLEARRDEINHGIAELRKLLRKLHLGTS